MIFSLIHQTLSLGHECYGRSPLTASLYISETRANGDTKLTIIDCDAHVLTEVSSDNPWLTIIDINRKDSIKPALTIEKLLCSSRLTSYNVKRYEIKTLKNKSFWNCSSLIVLTMEDCDISEISEDAFLGLSNLKFLFLTNNQIQEFQANVFWPLKSLISVILDHNPLKSLPKARFEKNVDLIGLGLNYVNFTAIPELMNLHILRIMGNSLQTVFVSDAIKILLVGNNFVDHITCDNSNKDIIEFSAEDNNLTDFHCIEWFSNLIYLNISNNKFTHFEMKWFEDLKLLDTLDICGNPLIDFDASALFPLKALRCLALDQTQNFTTLQRPLPHLKYVYITNRPANITKYRFFGEYLKYTTIKILNSRCIEE